MWGMVYCTMTLAIHLCCNCSRHEAEIAEMERKVERENIAFQELLKALTDFITVVKVSD